MNRPSFDEWAFMLIDVIKLRSEDPDTQVGCVILDDHGRLVSAGYNGLPRKLTDKEFSMKRPMKYKHVVHADMNAILSAERHRLVGSTIYVPFLPCCECAKAIIQSGITTVKYLDDYLSKDKEANHDIGENMLKSAGVKLKLWN